MEGKEEEKEEEKEDVETEKTNNENKNDKDIKKEKEKIKQRNKRKRKHKNIAKVNRKEKEMENEKPEEKKEGYYIPYILVDESIIKIISVFKEGNNLIADVEKNKNGKIVRERMRTKDIKEINPWILINYYESKIKFGL